MKKWKIDLIGIWKFYLKKFPRNIYKKEKFPYDMGLMQEYARAKGKSLHELTAEEMEMFVIKDWRKKG